MSFTYKGHNLPLWTSIDRDMSQIALCDERCEVVETFDLSERMEVEVLVATLNARFERSSREIATNPRAGHPAEFLTSPATTTEELCDALDHIWMCGGDGYPSRIITPLCKAGLIYIEQYTDTARLTDDTAHAWQVWCDRSLAAGHR
jgi:hypothetical protein